MNTATLNKEFSNVHSFFESPMEAIAVFETLYHYDAGTCLMPIITGIEKSLESGDFEAHLYAFHFVVHVSDEHPELVNIVKPIKERLKDYIG